MKNDVKIELLPFVLFLICQSILIIYVCFDDQEIGEWLLKCKIVSIKHSFFKLIAVSGSLVCYGGSLASLAGNYVNRKNDSSANPKTKSSDQ